MMILYHVFMEFKLQNEKDSPRGVFITFEGADGCGKTTQINLLKDYLAEKNIESVVTYEPGDCDIGKELRKILLHHDGFISNKSELFMYLADRSQHCKTVIEKNLIEKKVVLCDRFIDSTVAYQGYARGLNIEEIEYLNIAAIENLYPDITFLLDIDSTIAQKRLGETKDRLENEGLEFHKKVRFGYLELAKKNPERIKVIDASKKIEEVFSEIKKHIDKLL